jgi:type I restriction enzyme S subunit
MIAGIKPYPAYKDSGVPWLGQVPEHWKIAPLKYATHVNARVLPENTNPDYKFRYIDIGSVDTGRLVTKPQELVFSDAPSRARRIVCRGDTLLSTVRTYLKAVYFVRDDANDLIASTGFAVLTPGSSVNSSFVSYCVQSDPFTEQVSAHSVGIAYPAIAETRLGRFSIPIPPLPEQHAIARFLDHFDRRANRYIRAKRRLIALLNEQKQAIIHRAVTHGLDPDAPLKPSGVAWLGEIPEHWEEHPAKYYFREVDERSTSGEEELLSVSHITGVTPRSQKSITMFKAQSYVGHKICRPGDLVINTMWAWMGALGVAKQTGIVSPSYAVYRPSGPVLFASDFVDSLLRTRPYISEYICRSTGIRSSRLRLYPEKFLAIPIVRPSIEEQLGIVEAIEKETKELNRAINQAQRQIDLIREYRTRLIADVVTGKLDVGRQESAWAAGLPEEAETELSWAEDILTDADEDTLEESISNEELV